MLDERVEESSGKRSTTRIVKLIGDFAESLSSSSSAASYTVSKKNFAFQGTRRSVDDFQGISVDVLYEPSGVVISSVETGTSVKKVGINYSRQKCRYKKSVVIKTGSLVTRQK